ncbi:VOC family protein [Lewinella sp. IMCC34191]|uniref:VOC family protein n=1 Tax=Lewinella sp. IMCC34191 TaxID=2259172 RepID=UPI000E26618B|nr:VOC family protein [Lewinella sp. IMCC34191]
MNLNQITVPSRNLTLAIPFYECLGLQLIVRSLPHYARFVCPDGSATFSLHLVDELPRGEGIYVYFECEDLDGYVANLIQQGIEFDEPPEDRRWGWREARLRDPDGNRLILYYGGAYRLNPPWRVKD